MPDADFHNAPTEKRPDYQPPPAAGGGTAVVAVRRPGFFGRIKLWAKRHTALLWMLHSVYALFLGVLVMLFAAKGFQHARILAATLGGAFLLSIVIFRLFGQGAEQKAKVAEKKYGRIQFLGMTYFLKNMYQGMLFFLLPFYWKSSSLDSMNAWFVILLAVLAVLSTMDLVFDHVLMRFKVLAAIFYAVTLFACANLVIPAFFDNVPAIVSLLASTVLSIIGFWLLHFPLRTLLEKRTWGTIGGVAVAALIAVYFARGTLPPVPLYVRHGGVGVEQLADGRLVYEVTRVHRSRVTSLFAVTDVALPGGQGDDFRHVWRHRDGELRVVEDARVLPGGEPGTVRVVSGVPAQKIPQNPVGEWTVDVVTTDDQIVGRTRFTVIE
ncbi:MAG: DUF2914 domain-containing protein [Deltaproteobacteria bacterium]|nr:DUF2914 domain-containing protein [Deltaproteobacteria bacterium]